MMSMNVYTDYRTVRLVLYNLNKTMKIINIFIIFVDIE